MGVTGKRGFVFWVFLSFKENRAYVIRVKEPSLISLFPDPLTFSLSFGSKDNDSKILEEITVGDRNMGDAWHPMSSCIQQVVCVEQRTEATVLSRVIL